MWGYPHRGQMETPQYSDINDAELREMETEFGHPLTRELAQWFIRNRTNREAVERMLRDKDATELAQIRTMVAIAR
jgi:hypothetical protein